jgi:hypothetical protein
MALTYIENAHKGYYSTYRPIELTVHDASNDTAFMRAELFIETPLLSGTFESTGIIINAYARAGNPVAYDFNLMEYCRNYVSPGVCPMVSTATWLLPGCYETDRFRIEAWAVKHSQTTIGGLYDDLSDVKTSMSFIAIGTVTTDEDSGDVNDNYEALDRFVLGQNDGWLSQADTALPLTDMPVSKQWLMPSGKHCTININDFPDASLYSPVNLNSNVEYVSAQYFVWPLGGGTPSSFTIPMGGTQPPTANYRVPLHPKSVEYAYFQAHGTNLNQLVNTSGELICNAISVCLTMHNSNYTTYYPWKSRKDDGSTLIQYYHFPYSDQPNNGLCSSPKCRRVKFVFKNMRGGFDWFNAYGTQSKQVAVSGTNFDNHINSNFRGFHGRKQLWTKREDMFTVMTQPLDTAHAEWLQQLVTSPQVWVQREIPEGDSRKSLTTFLQPILIDQGSYDIHNTEDNIHYIEFKYHYSNPITTQIG